MLEKKWIEWLALNLAMGTPTADLIFKSKEANKDEDILLEINRIKKSEIFPALEKICNELKGYHALHNTLASLEEQNIKSREIENIDFICREDFYEKYYKKNRPVIIKGAAKQWPAIKKWSFESIKEKFGDQLVTCQDRRDKRNHLDCFTQSPLKISLSKFIEKSKEYKSGDLYIIAHDRLLERAAFHCLFDDMLLDNYIFDNTKKIGRMFLWIGAQGGRTPMHRDLANVYLIQIVGRKNVKMLSPFHSHKMRSEGTYFSKIDFESEEPDEELTRSLIEGTVYPGDLLFIPVGWWHDIKALDCVISITGNNFAFPNSFEAIF